MEFTAAKVFFEGKKKDLILNDFIKENKHIIIVSLENSVISYFAEEYQNKETGHYKLRTWSIMELMMHTWH